MSGPKFIHTNERRQRAVEIATRFHQHYDKRTIAIGVYGSLARQMDGPYSDIEMFVVIEGQGIWAPIEWATPDWKAEVDVCSADVLESQAAEVESDWPITHGAFKNIWAIYDPTEFFPRLEQSVDSHSDLAFQKQMEGLIVGEIFEVVGKIRNAVYKANADPLAAYLTELTIYGARLIGLANRHTYRGYSLIFQDSLHLPNLPQGYRDLCGAAMCGDLRSPQLILELSDSFWDGVEAWARERNLTIYTDLDTLLKSTST